MWTCEVLRFMLFFVVYSFILKLRGVNKISRLKLVTHMQKSRESGARTQEHSWAPPPFRERNQEEVGGFLLCWPCVAPSRALRTLSRDCQTLLLVFLYVNLFLRLLHLAALNKCSDTVSATFQSLTKTEVQHVYMHKHTHTSICT